MSSLIGFKVDFLTPSATAIMYMRRCGIPFETIAKVTGHTNVESLIKHYDLALEVGEPLSLALNEFLFDQTLCPCNSPDP